jgi:hypothetical protein
LFYFIIIIEQKTQSENSISISMARPNQETIDTFISITGVSEPVALQKLEVPFRFSLF